MWKTYSIIGVLFCITALALLGVFLVNGFPVSQQAIAQDRLRLNDFSSLSYRISDYYSTHKQLPSTLDDLRGTQKLSDTELKFTDSVTKKKYDYKTKDEHTYQLCTTFSASSKDQQSVKGSPLGYYASVDSSQKQEYKKGYACITYALPTYMYQTTPLPTSTYQYIAPQVVTPTPVNKIRYPVKGLIVCAENNLNVQWFSTGKGDHHVEVGLVTPEGKSYTLGTVNIPHATETEMLDQYTWNVPSTVSAHGLSMETGYYVTVSDTLNGKVSNTNGETFEIRKCVGN